MSGPSLMLLTDGISTEQLGDKFKAIASWTATDVPKGHCSIPVAMEDDFVAIRREYLAWVYDLGNWKTKNGATLAEHLALPGQGLSLYFCSLISEKSPLKSEAIYQIFKLRTLEKLYLTLGCQGIIYQGSNAVLSRTLQEWCSSIGHPYHVDLDPARPQEKQSFLRRAYQVLPFAIQGLGFLARRWFHRYRHPSLRRNSATRSNGATSHATIVSYFPNIDLAAAEKGVFRSQYWGKLHDLLDQLQIHIDWVLLYVDLGQLTFPQAIEMRDRFEKTSQGKASFYLLDEFATPKACRSALKIWLRTYWKGLTTGSIRDAFRFGGSSLCFYRFLERDWKSSVFGTVAMDNAIWLSVFESMTNEVPEPEWGMYLWEGQAWELALTSAWRKRSEAEILAYQHSSLRPLDIRFFSDSRTYEEPMTELRPLPDQLLVNGSAAYDLMAATGYPEDRLTKVEATRYYDLLGAYGKDTKPIPPQGRTLLVVGGYLPHETRFLLRLLEEASKLGGIATYSRILLKPHPYLPLDPFVREINPSFEYKITKDPIRELWPQAHAAFCANSTTALLEAIWRGIPALCAATEDRMNLNPLFSPGSTLFIREAKELAKFLENPTQAKISPSYFELNDELRLWRSALQ